MGFLGRQNSSFLHFSNANLLAAPIFFKGKK
jgi:hypothetical protein